MTSRHSRRERRKMAIRNPSRALPQSSFNIHHEEIIAFLRSSDATNFVFQHQIDAVLKAEEQLKDKSNSNITLVVLPTGCGKTGVAVLCAYALNAARVLIITPSVKISKQIYQAFRGSEDEAFLVKRGIVHPDDWHLFRPSGACITKSCEIPYHLEDQFMVVNAHKIGGQSRVAINDIPCDGYDLVIVDEAHHYPAPTWKYLVDYFRKSRRLFLTATPYHNGKPILPYEPCYELSFPDAIKNGVIRDHDFDEIGDEEANSRNEDSAAALRAVYEAVAAHIEKYLEEHDRQDRSIKHQAMVLTQTKETLNAATDFEKAYNNQFPEKCEAYISGTSQEVLRKFEDGKIRTLVIIGKLLEGFDRKEISVVGIVRNVAPSSRVLFAQFIGRAVRKAHKEDPVKTMIVTHKCYNQKQNYEQFDRVAEDDVVVEDED